MPAGWKTALVLLAIFSAILLFGCADQPGEDSVIDPQTSAQAITFVDPEDPEGSAEREDLVREEQETAKKTEKNDGKAAESFPGASFDYKIDMSVDGTVERNTGTDRFDNMLKDKNASNRWNR